MILEKMLELLLMEYYKTDIAYYIKEVDESKYHERLEKLRDEFLEPYVIDFTSKE